MPSGAGRRPVAEANVHRRGSDRLAGIAIAIASSLLLWALIALVVAAVIEAAP